MNEELNAQISQILADVKKIIDNQNTILSNIPTTQALNAEFAKKVNINDFTAIKNAMNIHLSQKNFGENGYTKLPNGLILQWMKISFATYNQIINFPIAFPTRGLCIVGSSVGEASGATNCIELEIKTNSSFRVAMSYAAPTYKEPFYIFAVGY